jgi:outer membrane PBP1 activator LpoA protein
LLHFRAKPTLQDLSATCSVKLKNPLWPVLLALALSACAASPAELKAAQLKRDQIATGYELTADGWQRLGVNEEQQAHYRKLADEARKAPAGKDFQADSALNRLLKAILGQPPGAAP